MKIGLPLLFALLFTFLSFTKRISRPHSFSEKTSTEHTVEKNSAIVTKSSRDVLQRFWANVPFVENRGQLQHFYGLDLEKTGQVRFYNQVRGRTVFFGEQSLGVGFYDRGKKARTFFYLCHEGSSLASLKGYESTGTRLNYYKGDSQHFVDEISSYRKIVYKNLYAGIDLHYRMDDGEMTFEYVVAPNALPSRIRRRIEGVKGLSISKTGELEIKTKLGSVFDKRPEAWQIINGKKHAVEIQYELLSAFCVGFNVGNYDKRYELILDPPTLSLCTWATIGGDDGYINDITVDKNGDVYAAGWINGNNPGSLVGPIDNNPAGGDAIVFKMNGTTGAIVYATFIGGDAIAGDNECAFGIAVNTNNQAYIVGYTSSSSNFPFGGSPLSNSIAGDKDIFVVKLAATGALVYSTLYGGPGDDRAFGVCVNSNDEIFITGWTNSNTGMSTAGAYQTALAGGYDAFVLKLSDPTPGVVVRNYCTYFGGVTNDVAREISVNGSVAVIAGTTQSINLPTTIGSGFGGGTNVGTYDAFAAAITGASGQTLQYACYIGGDQTDRAEDIIVHTNGEAYITGYTYSTNKVTGGFPIVNELPGFNQNAGGRDAFIAHLSTTGAILHSMFIGTAFDDVSKNGDPLTSTNQHRSSGIAVNPYGDVALVFATSDGKGGVPNTLPYVSAVDNTFGGGDHGLADAYLIYFAKDWQTIRFSTLFGNDGNDYPTAGVEFDPTNPECLFISGASHSSSLPTTNGGSRLGVPAMDESYVVKYCSLPLPAELLSFEALHAKDEIYLKWKTASEKSTRNFVLERSYDGIKFEELAQIPAAGNSNSIKSYASHDQDLTNGRRYYRLKIVDVDGSITGSSVISLTISGSWIASVNTIGQLTLSGLQPDNENLSVKLLNTQGVYYKLTEVVANQNTRVYELPKVESGVYIVEVFSGGSKQYQRLIIQ